MKFKKQILPPDTYHAPAGTVEVDGDRLKHWEDTFSTMKERGVKVGVAWDHPKDPLSEAQPLEGKFSGSAQDNIGFLESITVIDDAAEIIIDVPREEDAEKVRHNLAEVSPVIFPEWKDGKANTYEDCITQIGLVRLPVEANQAPFQLVMSTVDGHEIYKLPEATSSTITMSTVDGSTVYKLATDMEEEKAEVEKSGIPVDLERLKHIIELLADDQLMMPEDTTAENFFERLEATLLTKKAIEEKQMGSQDLEPSKEVATLSTDTTDTKPQDPTPLEMYSTREHREKRAIELSTLIKTGRCTPAEAEERKESVQIIMMDLNDKGEHKLTSVEEWIESRKACPPGTFWTDEQKTTMMSNDLVALQHPPGTTAEETRESAKANANEILSRRRGGGPKVTLPAK